MHFTYWDTSPTICPTEWHHRGRHHDRNCIDLRCIGFYWLSWFGHRLGRPAQGPTQTWRQAILIHPISNPLKCLGAARLPFFVRLIASLQDQQKLTMNTSYAEYDLYIFYLFEQNAYYVSIKAQQHTWRMTHDYNRIGLRRIGFHRPGGISHRLGRPTQGRSQSHPQAILSWLNDFQPPENFGAARLLFSS